ncbi:YbaN family protein [Haloplasma contractile]|uniref:Secreted protein n=1 Tax=Haloplasma contractile SSD-17B TaxID=1033810 RepID=U2DSQ4_9MOLU|nr:YbaN family protein [Haloplasma contractile]ERJ11522.1 Putative secreted protein [Haloplasma contractile SSD-17B]
MKMVSKVALIILGTISLVVGVINLLLPVLPTVPFLLIAAACYIRSSETMYNWLTGNKYFGSHIKNYHEGKGITKRNKFLTIVITWISILVSSIVFMPYLIGKIIMIGAAILVTIYMLIVTTYEDDDNSNF